LIRDHHAVHGSQGIGGQLQKAQMDVAQVEADRDFRL
jgi:hypothetical protein